MGALGPCLLYDGVCMLWLKQRKCMWGENMVGPLVVKAKTVYGGPTMAKVASSTY